MIIKNNKIYLREILKVIIIFAAMLFVFGFCDTAFAKSEDVVNDAVVKNAKSINVGDSVIVTYANNPDGKDIVWCKFVPKEDGKYICSVTNIDSFVYFGFAIYRKQDGVYEFLERKENIKNYVNAFCNYKLEKGKEYFIALYGTTDLTGKFKFEINKSLAVTKLDNINVSKFYASTGSISADVTYEDGSTTKMYCDVVSGQIMQNEDRYHNVLSIDRTAQIENAFSSNDNADVGELSTNLKIQNVKTSVKLDLHSLNSINLPAKELNLGDVIEVTPEGVLYHIENYSDKKYMLIHDESEPLNEEYRVNVMTYRTDRPFYHCDLFKGNGGIVLYNLGDMVFIRSFEGKAKFKVGTYGYDNSVSSLGLPAQITTKIDSIYDLGNDLIVKPANMGLNRIVWTSSNPAVATVSKSGKLTAIAAGTTNITATVDGKTAICKVTVNRLPQQITDVRVKIDSNSKKYKKNLRITVKKSKLVKNSKKKNNNRKTKICKISAKSKTTVNFKYTSKNNKFSIDKNGNVYVKNRIRKGRYTLKFKLTASKSNRYKVRNKTLQIVVEVK